MMVEPVYPNPEAPAPPPAVPPAFKLYSTGQVTAASFFGGPLAGAILLSHNYRRRGLAQRATAALVLGVLANAILLALVFVLTDRIGHVLPLATVIAVRAIAQADQPRYDEHVKAGGAKASPWGAVGAAAASLALICAVVTVVVVVQGEAHHVDFGHEQTITYEEGASESDAKRLGAFLKTAGYFDDTSPAAVKLSKKGGGCVVDFAVADGGWTRPDQVSIITHLGKMLGAQIFPSVPVTVEMCDASFAVKKTIVGRPRAHLDFGNDQDIVYEADATLADAKTLGDFFMQSGFFGDKVKGKDVTIVKVGSRYDVQVIAPEEKLGDPGVVASFEGLRKEIAAKAFPGSPVTLDLCDAQAEPKKTLGP
jgi:hypothetical protein